MKERKKRKKERKKEEGRKKDVKINKSIFPINF